MSVSGISSSSFFAEYNPTTTQNNFQQFQPDFQQLGQDLQSGNLSAAQSDFATLQANAPQGGSLTGSSQSNNPIAQAFNQLSSDLQSGNLSAAQQDYSTIQSDLQSHSAHGHHHHHGGEGGSSSSAQSEIGQLFSELGSALQSGNLSTAQQTYATLQQDLQQYAQGNPSATSTSAQSSSGNFSVNG